MEEEKTYRTSGLAHAEASEKSIEAYLSRKAMAAGGVALKMVGGRGEPDRLVLLPGGWSAWVELKSAGQKPRPVQEAMMRRLRALGQRVWVCDSKDKVDMVLEAWRAWRR